jgi:peptidoglycan hydrolase CwlO-like protein
MIAKLPALKGTPTPKCKVRRPIASALSYRNMRRSKSRQDRICLKQQSEVASLRSEVASLREAVVALQAAARPKTAATIDAARAAEREAAKRRRAEEREAASKNMLRS